MIVLLAVLGFSLVVAASIIFTSLRVSIPPMPTSPAMRGVMIALLKKHYRGNSIVELGSGWGGLSRHAARIFPDTPVLGIEMSLFPYLYARLVNALFRLENLRFQKGNIFSQRVTPDTAYLCYLSPGLMERLGGKLLNGETGGSLVLSAVFALPGWKPYDEERVPDLLRSRVYVYQLG